MESAITMSVRPPPPPSLPSRVVAAVDGVEVDDVGRDGRRKALTGVQSRLSRAVAHSPPDHFHPEIARRVNGLPPAAPAGRQVREESERGGEGEPGEQTVRHNRVSSQSRNGAKSRDQLRRRGATPTGKKAPNQCRTRSDHRR